MECFSPLEFARDLDHVKNESKLPLRTNGIFCIMIIVISWPIGKLRQCRNMHMLLSTKVGLLNAPVSFVISHFFSIAVGLATPLKAAFQAPRRQPRYSSPYPASLLFSYRRPSSSNLRRKWLSRRGDRCWRRERQTSKYRTNRRQSSQWRAGRPPIQEQQRSIEPCSCLPLPLPSGPWTASRLSSKC